MRTTVDIPDDLLEEARLASRARTNREAIIAGLQELIRRVHREELRGMAGKLELDVDIGRSRKRPTS